MNDTICAPIDCLRQTFANGTNIGVQLTNNGVPAEDILVPLFGTNGQLFQFSFLSIFHMVCTSKVLDLLSGDDIYNVILQSGESTSLSPFLALKLHKNKFVLEVCGSSTLSAKDAGNTTCKDHNLGTMIPGTWTNWVIHSKISNIAGEGFVYLWKDGNHQLSLTNIVTGFQDSEKTPPYLQLGSYVTSWKEGNPTPYPWAAIEFRRCRFGSVNNSTFNDIYTGTIKPKSSSTAFGYKSLLLATVQY